MTAFRYPNDILRQLSDAWGRPIWREGEVPALPPDRVMKEVLEIAYHASFTSDEQRSTQFRLALCKRHEGPGASSFEHAREFSVHELMRLAPAADVESLAIGVDISGPSSPRIWGLTSQATYDVPLVAAYAPGNLEVQRGQWTILTLRNGAVAAATEMPGHFIEDTFQEATKALWEGVDWSLGNAVPRDFWCVLPFRDLLQAIMRHGHGGSVFVLPHHFASKMDLGELVRIKYVMRDKHVWPILRTGVLQTNGGNAHLGHPDWELVSHTVNRFARLTRVDGALLLTDRFELLGFGAEGVATAALNTVQVIDGIDEDAIEGRQEGIDNYGTRHRSAFRLCQSCHGAVAFVCSQDGGIKCVRYQRGGVTVRKFSR